MYVEVYYAFDVSSLTYVKKNTDLQSEVTLPLAARFELNGELDLHKAVYNEIIATSNDGKPLALEISTFCDAPAGSGLGSSSTLVVVMLRAFAELPV